MRIFLTFIFAVILATGMASASHAQSMPTTPGCGEAQWEAAQAAARARMAQEVAAHEEGVAPADSVLATSCFDQAAQVSATEGGNIFSGNFMDQMTPVVLGPLQNLLNVNFLGSIGKNADFGAVVTNVLGSLLGGIFGSSFSSSSFNCTVQQDLYDSVMIQGINDNIMLPSADGMIAMALGGSNGGNNRYLAGMQASQDIFLNLQQTIDAIALPQAPSLSGAYGLDGVLQQVYGVGP